MNRSRWFLPTTATLGFIFLYAPILSLVVFSFNANRLVTVWSGFSLQSYVEPLGRPAAAAGAAGSASRSRRSRRSIATVLGTLCAVALVRFRRFRGKTVLQATVSAPLVMPDVITGLALLLLFVAMQSLIGWPAGRGMLTIVIAHATFCTAYVDGGGAVAAGRSRPQPRGSGDGSRRHAGAGVLRHHAADHRAGADLGLAARLHAVSLDDLVIASFVSGPGASTLPMVIYSKVRLGVAPEVNALATIIIGVVATGVIVATILQMRRKPARS